MRVGKAFSVFGLADRFRQEVSRLVKDEVQLAKVEMTEKIGIMKRNTISFAIGIFVSFAGLIVLSLALGRLLALAFVGFGWSRDLANFVGIAAAGFVIALIGGIFLLKAIKTLSSSSLKPEKTIETIRDLRGREHHPGPRKLREPAALQPTKEELAERIDHTRHELKDTMSKARRRLAWATGAAFLGRHVRRHPLRAAMIGACAGFASRVIKRRRARHS